MPNEREICRVMRPEEFRGGQARSGSVNPNKEIFLLLPGGGVQSVLPGSAASIPSNAAGVILLHRNAAVAGDAGACCQAFGRDRTLGGWCSYQCRLLSGRRFVSRHGAALLRGQSAKDVLTSCVRRALENAFSQADRAASSRQIWQQGKRLTEERLLDCGWQLERFIPQRLQIEGEHK